LPFRRDRFARRRFSLPDSSSRDSPPLSIRPAPGANECLRRGRRRALLRCLGEAARRSGLLLVHLMLSPDDSVGTHGRHWPGGGGTTWTSSMGPGAYRPLVVTSSPNGGKGRIEALCRTAGMRREAGVHGLPGKAGSPRRDGLSHIARLRQAEPRNQCPRAYPTACLPLSLAKPTEPRFEFDPFVLA
jgi:hypothetical protein